MKLTKEERSIIYVALGNYAHSVRELLDKATQLNVPIDRRELEIEEARAFDLQMKFVRSHSDGDNNG